MKKAERGGISCTLCAECGGISRAVCAACFDDERGIGVNAAAGRRCIEGQNKATGLSQNVKTHSNNPRF